MKHENISFWCLLVLSTAASLIPVYPPIPLTWICASLIWHHRYGPSWYIHNLDTDEDHIFILDLLICLPLAAVMMVAVLIEDGHRKPK